MLSFTWNSVNNHGSRDFLENYFESDQIEPDVKLKLKHLNEKNSTAQLILKTNHFLPYCWIYSNKGGLLFDKNFIHLLPGKHVFNLTFKELPEQNDFNSMWLNK